MNNNEREPVRKIIEIKVMPTKEVLERFLEGLHGHVTVIFDLEKGEFIDLEKGSQNG